MSNANSTDNTNYIEALFEKIRSQNKVVLEAVGDMQEELKQVSKRDGVDELKQDVKVINAAVTGLSSQVNDHDRRIGDLEASH